MLSSPRSLGIALAAVAALCLAAPISASAATTRYASPTGAGASPCVQSAPCSIDGALSVANGLANGDTVLLAPGTYHPAASLEVFRAITLSAEPGKSSPLIEAKGTFGLFLQDASVVHDIRIHSPAGTANGVAAGEGSVIERVESTGEANTACGFGAVTVRDSVCASVVSAGGGTGIFAFLAGGAPETQETDLFNVTAVGGGEGIVAAANNNSTVKVHATNTIASGGSLDVAARSFAASAPVEVTLSHSNFEEVELEGTNASITSSAAAGNQTAAPLFVDATAGDYREQEGSPTRLAGDLGVIQPGELDLAANPRTTNCAGTVGVDIGAYQFECPTPPPPPPPPQDGGGTGTTPTDNKPPVSPPAAPPRPTLSKLLLKPVKFTTTGKASRGTTISFSLSTAASVNLEVLAKKTVKGKKKTVTLGSLPPVSGTAGVNSVRFAGKLKGKPLDPGKYTLRATATAAGLSSPPASAGFEVRIP